MIGKKFEENNLTIFLNDLYVKKEKYILPMFHNIFKLRKKQVNLLMIPNGEG